MNGTPTTDTHFRNHAFRPADVESGSLALRTAGFMGPEEVLGDLHLTQDEKREVLASWASDVRTVPNEPSLRQLDNGAVVRVGDILRALNSLDNGNVFRRSTSDPRRMLGTPRLRLASRLKSALRRTGTDDDDDDPPPCPALIHRPHGGPLSGGETVASGMALAA